MEQVRKQQLRGKLIKYHKLTSKRSLNVISRIVNSFPLCKTTGISPLFSFSPSSFLPSTSHSQEESFAWINIRKGTLDRCNSGRATSPEMHSCVVSSTKILQYEMSASYYFTSLHSPNAGIHL